MKSSSPPLLMSLCAARLPALLATLCLLVMIAPSHGQGITTPFSADASNASIGRMSLINNYLLPTDVTALAAGSFIYNNLALRIEFTVPGSYTFEQVGGTNPVDTVGILYSSFDPANPQSGYITGDDDSGTIDLSGLKPAFTFTITGPSTRDVVISTYNRDTELGLPQEFQITGPGAVNIFSISTSGPPPEQLSAQFTGLPMANAMGQMLIGGNQTVTSDVNNHLFNLIAGDGDADAQGGNTVVTDLGVILGEGDGKEGPAARVVPRSRQWEVFTTVNYGNLNLSSIGGQAGVQVDAWAPGIGIERHLSLGLALGFAASFLTSEQTYTGGLGSLDLEGPALSTYLTYARRNFWSSLLYSFGSYDLDSQRNPGFGFPTAFGSSRTQTHSVQYNTGWNFRFQDNTLVTGPFAGIDWLHGTVDAYSETGGGLAALRFNEQSFESLVTRVGWAASKKIQTGFATITPQVRVGYERQNVTNNGTSVSLINAPFTAAGGNQNPGQDYLVAGAGVNFAFNDQLSLMLGYQGQFFRSDLAAHFGTLRIGYRF